MLLQPDWNPSTGGGKASCSRIALRARAYKRAAGTQSLREEVPLHRLAVVPAFFALALVALVPTAQAGTPPAGLTETPIASGLSQPAATGFLPGGRVLVTEKTGGLVLVKGATATTIATIQVCSGGEMGLLGIAPDPNFASNGFVYLYRTKPAPGGCGTATNRFNQVVRVKMVGDSVQSGSRTELLSGIRTDNTNHNGGALRIGPDQKLYVAVGDTGLGDGGPPGASTNPYAQSLGAL
jgi:glucose/arabinose dehydrogenase